MSDNAIEKRSRATEIALVMNEGPKLETIADAWTLAQAYQQAGMTPKTARGPMTANELMIVFMTGAELGFGPAWSLRNVTTFNGQSMVHSDGPISLVLKSKQMEWQKSGFTGTAGKDDYTAWYEVKRKGISEPVRREFSIGDARTAGLWDKGIWKQYGRVRMLFMRARAFALRDLFADVLGGINIFEEYIGHEVLEVNEPEAATVGSAGLLNALRAPAGEPEGHDVESEAVEAQPEPDEPVEATWQPVDEGDGPSPDEIAEIHAREMAEAGLFGGQE